MSQYRVLYFLAGVFFVALGAIGAFLPVLPTTPFVICAAFCFSKSSPKFENWLKYKSIFGPSILAWEKNRSIPFRVKIIATVMMAVSLVVIVNLEIALPVKFVLGLSLVASAIYIHSLPSN